MAALEELRERTVTLLERSAAARPASRAAAPAVEEPPPFSLFVPAELKIFCPSCR